MDQNEADYINALNNSHKSGHQIKQEVEKEFFKNFGCNPDEYDVRRKKFCEDNKISEDELLKSRKYREEWRDFTYTWSKK